MHSEAVEINVDFESLILEAEKLCERRNPEATRLIEQAEAMAVSGDIRQAALLQYIHAFCDCFVYNNYEGAIHRLAATLKGMDESLYPTIGYKLLMTLGNSYQLKGDLFSAQENYLKGLKTLSFKQADLTHIEKIFFAAFYYNLATLLTNTELETEGNDYLQQAIKIYKEIDNKFKLSQCYVALAQLLERQKEYNAAIDYLLQALAIGKEIKDPYSIALAMANLGVTYIKINDMQQALHYFKTALQYYEGNNLQYETAMIKLELAKAYCHIDECKKALQAVNSAEQIMTALNNRKELSEIYRVKADILDKCEEYKESNVYLNKYIESLKFFFDTEKTNALARAKKEFEWELQEKETKLLRDKNEEISQYAHKLEMSNNELKQFASVASHDLKEPLRMISSYLYLLKKSLGQAATEQQVEFCEFASDGARRMERMVQDLLRLARVDANERREPVNLKNILAEVKLNLSTLIKESNATVNTGELLTILADKAQMLQLFQNLVANGINYNTSGAPLININCRQTKNEIEITVTDNGIGIPQNFKEAAFQIFKTMPNDTGVKGTGIGLAICKKIVDKMQGTIQIEDVPTGGTTFKITWPMAVVS
ncbi:MAG TPA: ATP-binding protein [Chitinophagales bacterium]|nr:ATP-binding protein [Chitinophagales bacterium]